MKRAHMVDHDARLSHEVPLRRAKNRERSVIHVHVHPITILEHRGKLRMNDAPVEGPIQVQPRGRRGLVEERLPHQLDSRAWHDKVGLHRGQGERVEVRRTIATLLCT